MALNGQNYIWWLIKLRTRRMEINAGIDVGQFGAMGKLNIPNMQAVTDGTSAQRNSHIVPEATKADNNVSDGWQRDGSFSVTNRRI